MRSLEKHELKDLLNKCWMTHDGMWFYHCMRECGMEKANALNKAAIRSLAPIEMKRILNAFGIGSVETIADVNTLLEAAREAVIADFMGFSYSFPSDRVLHVGMHRCFAYEGMKRIAAIDEYECGIFVRVEAWFDYLGIQYSVSPQVEGCMMHQEGECYRDYTFSFPR